jgi:hypothetical protein
MVEGQSRNMHRVRRYLTVGSWLWLSLQLASWSALIPVDCCAEHRTASGAGAGCHEPRPGDACPMRGANGQACPMHSGPGSSEQACKMRGTCNQPSVALASLMRDAGTG